LGAEGLQAREDMDLGLILHGDRLGPGGDHTGEIHRMAIVAEGTAAIVCDEIRLAEAGLDVIPVGKGSHRDVVLQEGAGAGGAASLQTREVLGRR
jgi:hypothetical protein